MPSPRPHRRARSVPVERARRAGTVAVAIALIVIAAFGTTLGVGGAHAQGTPSTTSTRPASTSSSAKTSTSVATTAAPTTASTAAPTTAAPTTTIETTTTASTTTTVASTSTLPPPPPVENTRFPARLVAPVPPVEGGPERVVDAMYLAASEDAQAPDVVVHFRAPFALPSAKYQVSILVGDPNGSRARVSLVSPGAGGKPTGTVEVGDGTTWTSSGSTQVQHDPSGLVVIRVPLAATPAGGAVWAEILEGGGTAPSARTPFFDRTAFFGTADAGTLPATRFGRVNTADGKAAPDVAPLDAGPVLTVNQQKVYVKYEDEPPTALLGQPVREAVDIVRIIPNFDTAGVVGDSIRINRTEGTAALLDGFGATPVDKSGDRSWVVRGPDGPPGATTLVFDLAAAAELLGITLDPARTAVGLTRSFVLADGRIVTADGVVATTAWLDLAPPPLSASTGGTVPAGANAGTGSEDRTKLIAAATAVAAVLLVLGLVLALRRRRRRREDAAVTASMARRAEAGDRIPWAKNDSQLTQELDRVVIPGTAEHSLLPDANEPAVGTAPATVADVGAATVGAAVGAAIVGAAVVQEEPPPSVGHAGPVPWRSASSGSTPAVDLAAPAVASPASTSTGEVVGAVAADAADAVADDAKAKEAVADTPLIEPAVAGVGPAIEREPDPEPEPEPETDPEPDLEPEPTIAAAIAPEPETAPEPGAPAALPASVVLAPALPADRRRRRASGVVIAGPTVGDVVAPAPARGAAAPGPPVRDASGPGLGAAVVWASGPEAAPDRGAGADPATAEDEREENPDPNQIDPSDALAALDLDLGSFRHRFETDDPPPPDAPG